MHQTSSLGHVAQAGGVGCSTRTSASYPYDRAHDDFGMLPLMFSTGVGANGNSSLGTGVVGGMFIGTLALLFLVPGLFIAFQWLQEKIHPLDVNPNPDEMIKREMEEVDKIINN